MSESKILTGDYCELCGWESWECGCADKVHTCNDTCFKCGRAAPDGRKNLTTKNFQTLLLKKRGNVMSESKHTPGPWKVIHGTVQLHVYGPALSICTVGMSEYDKTKPVGTETEKANARLIAAAPELLATLRLYIADCEAELLEYNDDTYELAKAAIAKAERG